MHQTPQSNRTHIGIFGKRNAGKSSLLNAISEQNIALVSEIGGTTTDPVKKAMELIPYGPVLFIDTAGLDDKGTLGSLRTKRSKEMFAHIDFAIVLHSSKDIDPDLFEKLPIKEENGQLIVDVKCEVPAYLMGSGIGSASAYTGDYDIMTADQKAVKENNIDSLCFGDLVLLKNCDNTFGRGYLEGAVSIGVVVHSDCIKMGHGPGVTTIMTCKTGIIKGNICDKAEINIANLK
jgi:small GTP-binding protein